MQGEKLQPLRCGFPTRYEKLQLVEIYKSGKVAAHMVSARIVKGFTAEENEMMQTTQKTLDLPIHKVPNILVLFVRKDIWVPMNDEHMKMLSILLQ